jgi:uncharacterized protein YndB with AHSA1/START domain
MTETLTIQIDQYLPYAPAQIWKALTDPDLLGRWLMPNDFKLEIGHHFTFKNVPIPSVKFDGIAYCEVLDFEIERKLHISWAARGENGLNSTVTWRLEPEDSGTHLFMEHAGFDPENPLQQRAHQMMSHGWLHSPQHIAEILAAEKVADRT